jgi:hypothetical protein
MAQSNVSPQSPMSPRIEATGGKAGGKASRDGAAAPPSNDPSTTIQPSISHLVPANPTKPHDTQQYDSKTGKKAMNEQEDMEVSMSSPKSGKARANQALNEKQEAPRSRYGKDTDGDKNEPDMDEDDGMVGSPYVDLKKMNSAQLRQHAMRRFGMRYGDKETDDHIRGDIQKRMAVKTGMQRYRD